MGSGSCAALRLGTGVSQQTGSWCCSVQAGAGHLGNKRIRHRPLSVFLGYVQRKYLYLDLTAVLYTYFLYSTSSDFDHLLARHRKTPLSWSLKGNGALEYFTVGWGLERQS